MARRNDLRGGEVKSQYSVRASRTVQGLGNVCGIFGNSSIAIKKLISMVAKAALCSKMSPHHRVQLE